jgi:hypothetical protein
VLGPEPADADRGEQPTRSAPSRANHPDAVTTAHLARDEPKVVANSHGRQGRARRFQGDTVTSPATGAGTVPDYAPIPRSALGPPLNDQGYYVGQVERNLYWVTDGV